ncbi:MAG: PAS domain S-box protein [Xenococcaceae cyanobacterium]
MTNLVILCVDDEATILESIKEQLRRNLENEYEIETAESGEEALEIIEEFKEDSMEVALVISDQIMPRMKGDELLIDVHAHYPKILTVMLTGQANAQAVGNAVNSANLYRYIPKPWDETDLILTVKEALRSYRQQQQLSEQNKQLKKLNLSLEQKIEELRITEENYRSIFENALEGIFQCHPDGTYIKVNPVMARIYGYKSPDEMLTKIKKLARSLYVDSNHREQLQKLLEQQNEIKNFQYKIYQQDNTIVWLEENTRAVRDRHGKLLYYEGIIQDITQRKQEEAALLRQVKEMQIAIDKSRQAREVAQIVKTDSFQKVKQKLKKLRN